MYQFSEIIIDFYDEIVKIIYKSKKYLLILKI